MSYPSYVHSLPGLRGYWRLGDEASPWLDTAGYAITPYDMTESVNGSPPANTLHVAGCVADDDGALRFNQLGYGAARALQHGSTGIWAGTALSFSVAAWVKPGAGLGNSWRGGIFANHGFSGAFGEQGWALEMEWVSGTPRARFIRSLAAFEATASGNLATDTCALLVATYDGATRKLYVDGALVASDADARPDPTEVYGNPQIGRIIYQPAFVSEPGPFYGVIDEVAFFGRPLTADEIDVLFSSGPTTGPLGVYLPPELLR